MISWVGCALKGPAQYTWAGVEGLVCLVLSQAHHCCSGRCDAGKTEPHCRVGLIWQETQEVFLWPATVVRCRADVGSVHSGLSDLGTKGKKVIILTILANKLPALSQITYICFTNAKYKLAVRQYTCPNTFVCSKSLKQWISLQPTPLCEEY